MFNCICRSEFAIVITFNQLVFDFLFKEKIKRDGELLALFIHESIPGLKELYTLNKILKQAGNLFNKQKVSKGEIIVKEGG